MQRTKADPRHRSRDVTDGPARAPARAMLRAVGFSEEDFGKPQVGVASSWNEVTPCNVHLNRLAAAAKDGVRGAGAVPVEFTTIAVSDGIAMGHEGMRASLVSREAIADSVELVMHAERFDGMVTIAGCDKSLPGMVMAAARLDLPAVFLYGGTILPGVFGDRDITIQDVFEAVRAVSARAMSPEELLELGRGAASRSPSPPRRVRARFRWSSGRAVGVGAPPPADPDSRGFRECHRRGH